MKIYTAPIDDMAFQLKAFGYDQVAALEKYADYDFGTVEAMLRQTGTFVQEVLVPTNSAGDKEGLKWDPKTGSITTPTGFKEAYQHMRQNGFIGICGTPEYGGSGAPIVMGTCMSELWTSGNKSFSMCPGLTTGLVEALEAHASDEQKAFYLPKLLSGEWAGTMCLTEPQCGTDLGLLRTKAIPQDDGSYKITGTKIWITFGEQDFTDNIIHLVLARMPDAPAGIKGISVFVVPKVLDGKSNGVKCTGLEHKMGIKASPTCVIDLENSTGFLIGEPHKGMRAMFTMMNQARLLVGVEGIALSEISYQTALEFAKDRRQSRSLDPAKRDKKHGADNIMVHPDVRRLLLNVKSTVEAMRGLAVWVAHEIDISHHHADKQVRQDADDLVQLLTPIIKSYFSERGFLNISDAMQVCGGAGYTTDWNIEQYLRDERIAMIYEGTNHIQALDLVGRKLPRHGGRLLQGMSKRMGKFMKENADNATLKEFLGPLAKSAELLTTVTMELGGKAMQDPEEAGAGASNYLNLFALTVLAYSWVVQVKFAADNPELASGKNKLKTARYFFQFVLPEQATYAAQVRAGKAAIMDFAVSEF